MDESRERSLGERRGYDITETRRLQEIEDYGRDRERLMPPERVSGFRLHSIARYEERDGGVYLELEAIALTRDIPSLLRWLVGPVANRLSINSLAATLHPTRQALVSLSQPPNLAGSITCGRLEPDPI
jgi:hypothetical protein